MEIKASDIIRKKVTKSGNSAHIPISKRFMGKVAIVIFEGKKAQKVRVK